MDPLLLLAYFALPATITLVAFAGLKLHERSAPPLADVTGDLSQDGWETSSDGDVITTRIDAGRVSDKKERSGPFFSSEIESYSEPEQRSTPKADSPATNLDADGVELKQDGDIITIRMRAPRSRKGRNPATGETIEIRSGRPNSDGPISGIERDHAV
jgi:hypothetical protein